MKDLKSGGPLGTYSFVEALQASGLRSLCLWHSGHVTHAPDPSDKQTCLMGEHRTLMLTHWMGVGVCGKKCGTQKG